MCTGECEFESLGNGNWAKISDPCVDDCHCFTPVHKAMIGTPWRTDCNSDE